jgi:hydrogenase maturation protease
VSKILFIGYGNPDREDDGVAWHILRKVCLRLGLPAPESYEDEFPSNERADFAFSLQLTPEMAEEIAVYDHVCFVDAHTGNIQEQVRLIRVESEFQRSPFTHHLTPQSLLSFCETIYNRKPRAALLSVRGYHFRFSRELSKETSTLLPQAVDLVWDWMQAENMFTGSGMAQYD